MQLCNDIPQRDNNAWGDIGNALLLFPPRNADIKTSYKTENIILFAAGSAIIKKGLDFRLHGNDKKLNSKIAYCFKYG